MSQRSISARVSITRLCASDLGMLPENVLGNESDVSSVCSNHHDEEVVLWYFSREEIEKHSPSRLDGIDLKNETRLRKSYCTFLKNLGVRLKVPQITIATAIVFCHRFFLRQSHAKNDRWMIAIVCMFLAGKIEESPRPIKDIIIVAYEIIHKKELTPAQRKKVYEHQKELMISGEELVLSTLNFELSVCHPYKPLVEAIRTYICKEAKSQFPQVAWSFANDCLRTSLCLQYKPQQIAAGIFFLAAEHLTMDLQSYGKRLCREFDITPRQLEDIRGQMLELYEKKHIPAPRMRQSKVNLSKSDDHSVGIEKKNSEREAGGDHHCVHIRTVEDRQLEKAIKRRRLMDEIEDDKTMHNRSQSVEHSEILDATYSGGDCELMNDLKEMVVEDGEIVF